MPIIYICLRGCFARCWLRPAQAADLQQGMVVVLSVPGVFLTPLSGEAVPWAQAAGLQQEKIFLFFTHPFLLVAFSFWSKPFLSLSPLSCLLVSRLAQKVFFFNHLTP